MTDNTDLIAELNVWIIWAVKNKQGGLADLCQRVADALAARDALIATLRDALTAALRTFEVTE